MFAQTVLFTAAGIGITLVCLLGVSFLGPFGAFINFLTPLPAAYLGMRYGVKTAVIVVVVTCLLLFELASTYTFVAYLGLFGVGSLLLPYFLHRFTPWDRAILYTAAGAAGITAVIMLISVVINNASIPVVIDQVVQSEVDQALVVYQNAGLSADQLKDMELAIQGMGAFVKRGFYGLYLAILIAIQAFTLIVLQRVKVQGKPFGGPSFARWRTPPHLIWLLIAGGFLQFVPQATVVTIGWNILLVMLPLYFFQGLAVVHHFLRRKNYPRSVKSMLYLLLLVVNPLPIIVTSVGVFDLWIDFRRPRQKQI